jgi:hypothetical protein
MHFRCVTPGTGTITSAAALLMLTCLSCRSGGSSSEGRRVELDAGKRTSVFVEVPDGAVGDSIGTVAADSSVQIILPGGRVGLSASLVRCSGGDSSGRMADLASTEGIVAAETDHVEVRGDPDGGFDAVMYAEGDSCFVERIWTRGGGEVLVLRVSAQGDTPRTLLGMAQPVLSGATESDWPGLRSASLSTRNSAQIRAELEQEDVTPPPQVSHSLYLGIEPGAMTLSVADSFMVDFSPTPGLGRVSFFLPHVDAQATEVIVAIEGSCSREADSLVCVPDSATRIFRGAYTTLLDGFYMEEEGFVHGQVRLSSSFCSGEWIYPGNLLPSTYEVTASVPSGTSFYCPLLPSGSSVSEGRSLVSFVSPEGGIISPLPWAAGEFEEAFVASGRSRVFYGSEVDEQSARLSLISADMLATALWNGLGFEGARLDFVLLEGLGTPVLSSGPGCLMISPDILATLQGHQSWVDSLSSGLVPVAPRIVARGARAMLLLSTYLPDATADALSAYSVFLFERSWGSAAAADSLLEAFRLYYLNSSETAGGVEYSLADPMLPGSPLAEPVLMGKAPLVFAMLSEALPGFEYGLARGLGNLRHSGYCYGRIAAASGLGDGASADFYWDWLYMPGVPQICVTWADSAETIYIRIEQLQPGPDFPLPQPQARVIYSRGLPAVDYLEGPDAEGRYAIAAYPWGGRVVSIELWPGMVLPADIVYERQGSPGL